MKDKPLCYRHKAAMLTVEGPTEGCILDQQQTGVWETAPTQGDKVQLTLFLRRSDHWPI